MTTDNDENFPIDQHAIQKKSYHSPTLSSFGTVTQLTQTLTNMMKDDGGMGMANMIS